MYKGKFASELSMNEVKEYYDELRQKYPLTKEQRADFNILKEKLIAFAYKILKQEPCIQEKQANADAVYIDGFKAGYSQAKFDLEQEHCEDCDVRNSRLAIEATQKQSCDDAISRQEVLDEINRVGVKGFETYNDYSQLFDFVDTLPPATPQPKIGHCKECKYFEYNSMAKVDGIPLIVAHEICNKWGDGCKSRENGYCFLFEPRERSKE